MTLRGIQDAIVFLAVGGLSDRQVEVWKREGASLGRKQVRLDRRPVILHARWTRFVIVGEGKDRE